MSNTKADPALRMRRLRKALGDITQADMAERLDGVNRSTLASIESGRQWPSRNVMEALTERFNVNAGWLLLGEGTMFREDVLAWRDWTRKVQEAATFANLSAEFRAEFANSLGDVQAPDPAEMPPEPQTPIDHVEGVWMRFEESKRTGEAPSLPEPESPKKPLDEVTRLSLAKVRVAGVLEDYPAIKGIRTVEVAMWNIAMLDGVSLEHLYLLANAFSVLQTGR